MLSEAAFLERVKAGDRAGVEQALAQSPELSTAQEGGVSAVLWAVYHGHSPLGRVIADRKGELDVFEAAALGDRHRLAQILVQDPTAHARFSADGFTPLGYAAYFGHLECVHDLLRAGADPNVKSQNPLGVAPLHSALSNGSKEIARALLEAGADVNAVGSEGYTPLHYVAASGDVETARLLLERGARPGGRLADGRSAADLAREKGFTDLGRMLG